MKYKEITGTEQFHPKKMERPMRIPMISFFVSLSTFTLTTPILLIKDYFPPHNTQNVLGTCSCVIAHPLDECSKEQKLQIRILKLILSIKFITHNKNKFKQIILLYSQKFHKNRIIIHILFNLE